MIPDRLQFLLMIFGTSKNRPNMDPRTPYFSPNYFQMCKKIWEHLRNTLFSYMRIRHSESFGGFSYWTSRIFGMWNVEGLKFWIREIEMCISEIEANHLVRVTPGSQEARQQQNIWNWKNEVWEINIWIIWNLKTWKMENWI